MTPSLQLLGAGGSHSAHWRHFNHVPLVQPWARAGELAPPVVAQIITRYMGEGFPVETVEWGIIKALEGFQDLGAEAGMHEFLKAAGRDVRVILAAIRRNFKRRPELWAQAVA